MHPPPGDRARPPAPREPPGSGVSSVPQAPSLLAVRSPHPEDKPGSELGYRARQGPVPGRPGALRLPEGLRAVLARRGAGEGRLPRT